MEVKDVTRVCAQELILSEPKGHGRLYTHGIISDKQKGMIDFGNMFKYIKNSGDF